MKTVCRCLLAAVVAIVALTGCGRQALENNIKAEASHCPIPVEGVGEIVSIAPVGDTLVYTCIVTNPEIDMARLADVKNDVRLLLRPQLPSLFHDQRMLGLMAREGMWLGVIYRSLQPGDPQLDLAFSPEELGVIDSLYRAGGEAALQRAGSPEEQLANELAVARAHLPAPMSDDISLVSLADDGKAVVFRCMVDEEVAGADGLERLRGQQMELRAAMLEMLLSAENDDVNTLRTIAVNARRGIIYRYVGSTGADSVDVAFTVDDLTLPAY